MAPQNTPTNKAGRLGIKLLKMLTPIAGVLVFLAIWQAGVMISKVPAYLLPAPTEIARTFIDELPRLLRHGWVTTYEMLLGYLLAVAVAIPLAIAITSSQRFDQFVMPTMLFFQVVPKVAIAPLFLVWFGVGATAESSGRLPHFVLSNRHRRRGGLALHVVGDERSSALHGLEPHSDLHAIPIADQPSLPVQRAQSGRDARHCGRGGGRICRCGQGLGLSAAGDELQHGDGA